MPFTARGVYSTRWSKRFAVPGQGYVHRLVGIVGGVPHKKMPARHTHGLRVIDHAGTCILISRGELKTVPGQVCGNVIRCRLPPVFFMDQSFFSVTIATSCLEWLRW